MKNFLEDTNTLNISEIDIGFIVQTSKMHFVPDILFEFKSHRRQELAKNLIFLGKSILRIIRQMFQPSRGLEKLLEKTNLEDISENMRLYLWG